LINIVVNEELKSYIDPLPPDEHDALERSLLAEGCRDALVPWNEVLASSSQVRCAQRCSTRSWCRCSPPV
jgi:hypothetical protein